MKKISIILISIGLANALEFDIIGNTPASVGGAGVAYTKNSWAIHYNPAILGVNNNFNIAYSFGAGFAENNLAELANIDYQNIQNFPKEITKIIGIKQQKSTNQTIPISAFDMKSFQSAGQLGDILKNLGNGISDTQSLKDYLDKIIGGSNSIEDSINKLKDPNNIDKIIQIKQDLDDAISKAQDSGVDTGIIGNIIRNINDIPGLIDIINEVSNGNEVKLDDVLSKIGGIKIDYGVNKSLDKLIDDYQTIINSMQNNHLKIHSNNGLAFHMPVGFGSIGIGMLANINGHLSLEMDKKYNKLIIQNGNDYYEINIDGGGISLKPSDSSNYNSNSILNPNAKHTLRNNTIALVEVPIAYGTAIPFIAGDLYLGISAKYINATSMFQNQTFSLDNLKLDFNLKNNIKQSNTFGIDLGALYKIAGFSVGVVGKNLNTPKINTSIGKFVLDKQIRAGLGLEIWRFTILADIDIIPNTTLDPNKYSQMVGGGVIFDASYVDFRFGAMQDLKPNPYGVILTGGMNILSFLDFSIQSSLITEQINKYKIPNYIDIRVGGRFLF